MTPTTLTIDRSFRGVGRIKRATGSMRPDVRKKMNRMLDALAADARLDLLRALRDGDLTLPQLHYAYQRKELHKLPTADTVKPLADAMKAWIEGLVVGRDASAKHVESLETSRRYFERLDAKAPIADLPRMLDRLRESLGRKHPRSFNLAKAAASAFVRSTLKRSHPLWLAVAAVEVRKVGTGRAHAPLSPEQMRAFFPAPDTDALDAIAWGMATTGMGAGEYWGAWSLEADRVRIAGTKRQARNRSVPLTRAPAVPSMHRRTFENKLRERTARAIVAYDLRRTYANWMEAAGIPRTRRKLYLGHAAGDVTGLYELHEVAAFLAEDAETLRGYLGRSDTATLKIQPTKVHTMTLHTTKGA